MSTGSPEFVMPPPAPRAEGAPAQPASAGAVPTTAELDDAPPLTTTRSPRRTVRALLAVGAAGIVIGAAAQAGVLAAADATVEARVAAVEALALEYLTAIAEGRATDAAAMVPPHHRIGVAPDAVLAGAGAIRGYSATVVGGADGDTALVLVDFTVGGVDAQHLLDVRATDGRWQILTSLAEAPHIYHDSALATTVLAGVEFDPRQPPLLYPGAYRPDVVDSGLYRTVGNAFVIDGDPATPAEAWSGFEIDMETEITARGLALGVAEECQAAGTCEIPADAAVVALEHSELVALNSETGGITIGATIAFGEHWVEVRIRAARDPDSGLTSWLCPEPARLELPVVPCGH